MEFDSTLIAAIITSLATLVAALITIHSVKKNNKNREKTDKYSIFNKTYTILVREFDNKTMAVKDGFSWPGLFFHAIWALYSKLWEVIFTIALILGIIYVHLYLTDQVGKTNYLDYYIQLLASSSLVLHLFFGHFGNRFIIRKYTHSFCLLDDRKFRATDSVIATTKANAILKYMEKNNG